MAFIGILLVFLLFLAALFAVIAVLLGVGGVGIVSFISGIVLAITGGDQSYGRSKKKTVGIFLAVVGIIVLILVAIAAYKLWMIFV